MIISVCCLWAWGHSEAGRQVCNLDQANQEAPGWPAIGFSRLASAGVTGVTYMDERQGRYGK